MPTMLRPLCFLLLLAPIHAQLNNPGFEGAYQAANPNHETYSSGAILSGYVAHGWSDNSTWSNVEVRYSKDDVSPHRGQSCQKITVLKGFAQFGQPIQFPAGILQASIWMRAKSPFLASLTLRLQPAPYTSYGSTVTMIGTKWHKVSVEGYVPRPVPGVLLINTAGTGVLWLDDADFHPTKSQVRRYQTIKLAPPTTPVPGAYFGLNVNHMHDSPGFLWPALQFGAYRTWDSGVIWPQVNPKQGVYNWSWLDRDVEQAQLHHTKFLFTLGQTPTWASSDPTSRGVYGFGFNMPPAKISYWDEFLRAVVTRYKGRIEAYEIWNEPNITEFYNGSPASLVKLEKAAAATIHSIDKKALIVCPPMSGNNSLPALGWLNSYLAAGGGKNCNMIAYHLYNYPPEKDIAAMHAFREILKGYGLEHKPIWITENGAELQGDDIRAANVVAREYLLDWALGVQRLYLYAYDNSAYIGLDCYGQPGGAAQLDRAGVAYQQVRKWLLGSTMLSCQQDNTGIWTCQLKGPNGKIAWVVWSVAGNRSFPILASWRITKSWDLAGKMRPITGDEIVANGTPIELE